MSFWCSSRTKHPLPGAVLLKFWKKRPSVLRHNAFTCGTKNSLALVPQRTGITNRPSTHAHARLIREFASLTCPPFTLRLCCGLILIFHSSFCFLANVTFSTASFPSRWCYCRAWLPDPLSLIMKTALANLISSADFINALFVLLSRYFRRKSSNVDKSSFN